MEVTILYQGEVSELGYQWTTREKDKEPQLAALVEEGCMLRRADVQPGSFLTFADTEPTRDGILRFATEYGHQLIDFDSVESRVKNGQQGVWGYGSKLRTWQQAIADVREAVNLWQNVRARDVEKLKEVIKWQENKDRSKYVIYEGKNRWSVVAHSASLMSGVEYSGFREGEILLPARYALQRLINDRLETLNIAPHLTMVRNGQTELGQRVLFQPSNLLAAMWLRFAEVVAGDWDMRKCATTGCGRYFPITPGAPGARRADSITCSDRCRQRLKQESDQRRAGKATK
ncbi:hypothetical protein [Edaphobacter albus]|uniref:hypothetical protein n=1 Tax=Edaphobacter sp. 4G125 TaxID=2763071 RepID=UPI0016479C75|nr:hypothetical protein [Edaphobacter sp. 4G125]QNI35455.1 hypothetical protein H7846_10220 [Edaphobacter sp. 4G125]